MSATSNSTGAFTYTVVSGPATISGSTVTLTGAGTVVLQASEAADSNYAAATQERDLHRHCRHPDHRLHRLEPDLWRRSLRGERHLELDRSLHLHGGLGPGDHLGLDRHPDRRGHCGAQASEAADSNYAAATKNATFTVTAGTPTITFTVANQTYGTAPFAVSATSNSTGAFTYTVVSGPATISGSTVTLTGAGTVVLRRPKRRTATTPPPPRTRPSPSLPAPRPSASPWRTRPMAPLPSR